MSNDENSIDDREALILQRRQEAAERQWYVYHTKDNGVQESKVEPGATEKTILESMRQNGWDGTEYRKANDYAELEIAKKDMALVRQREEQQAIINTPAPCENVKADTDEAKSWVASFDLAAGKSPKRGR